MYSVIALRNTILSNLYGHYWERLCSVTLVTSVDLLTAIYAFVPTYVFAIEFTSCKRKVKCSYGLDRNYQ